jgi:hypothetical protein
MNPLRAACHTIFIRIMEEPSLDQTPLPANLWLRRTAVFSVVLPAVSIPIVVAIVSLSNWPITVIGWAFWLYLASFVFGLTTSITVWYRRVGNLWPALVGTVLSAGCGLVAGVFWVLGHIPINC